MSTQQNKAFRGWLAFKKTGGQIATGPALNTTYSPPALSVDPVNDDNFTYPAVMNAVGAPSVLVQGMKTPALVATFPLKRSFTTAAMFNSFIGGSDSYLDSNYNADVYLAGMSNGNTIRYWKDCQCQTLTISASAQGGPLVCETHWVAVAGDSENSPGSITPPTTDAGTLMDVTQYDWGGSATLDAGYTWSLMLVRPTAYQPVGAGSRYSDPLQSGAFGFIFQYSTSPLAATVPSTTATLRIKIADTPTYVTFTMNLNRDSYRERLVPGLGVCVRSYTGINTSGGYPITIA